MNRFKILLIIILLTVVSFNSTSSETIQIVTGEWSPYTSENKSNNLVERIVHEILLNKDIDYEINHYPWRRVYDMVKIGEAHLTFPWVKTDKREEDFIFTKEAIYYEKQVFVYKTGSDFDWNEIDDLRKYKLGATKGFFQKETYEKNDLKYIENANELSNFRLILADRLDAYLIPFYAGKANVIKNFPEEKHQFSFHEKPLQVRGTYILVSKEIENAQALADIFDEGLRELKASGRYQEIFDNFFAEYEKLNM